MGVKYLWDIIDDARSIQTLDCLRGRTIAIDLSIWIVEAIKTLQFKSGILKPHLRNIFFRVLFLRRLGVKLIFVTEGEAPDLKQAAMKKRALAQYGVKLKTKGRMGRSRFQRTIDECTRMLDLIGLPHVQAHGEAEAMCAVLNKHGLVDGCLTNDGDFFLYGGETIYRDFGINPKDQHVLVYDMKTIKERTGLHRHDMIALALLNGCDYTEGVPGVGKRTVKKFLEEKNFPEDLLIRFQKWNDEDFNKSDLSSDAELTIYKKIKGKISFPNDQIIDEFLVQKDRLDKLRGKMKWLYPSIKDLQEYLLKNLEWPEEYTLPKILQLATSTYLEKLSDSTYFPVPIQPNRIVKTKCQMGVSLVDIEWQKYSDENTTYSKKWLNCPESFITLENQQVVSKTLPHLVKQYNTLKENKKKAPSKKKTKPKDKENETPSDETSKHGYDSTEKVLHHIKKSNHETESALVEQNHGIGNENQCSQFQHGSTLSRFSMNDEENNVKTLPTFDHRLESKFKSSLTEIGQENNAQGLQSLSDPLFKEDPKSSSRKIEIDSDTESDDDDILLPSLSERLARMKLDSRKTSSLHTSELCKVTDAAERCQTSDGAEFNSQYVDSGNEEWSVSSPQVQTSDEKSSSVSNVENEGSHREERVVTAQGKVSNESFCLVVNSDNEKKSNVGCQREHASSFSYAHTEESDEESRLVTCDENVYEQRWNDQREDPNSIMKETLDTGYNGPCRPQQEKRSDEEESNFVLIGEDVFSPCIVSKNCKPKSTKSFHFYSKTCRISEDKIGPVLCDNTSCNIIKTRNKSFEGSNDDIMFMNDDVSSPCIINDKKRGIKPPQQYQNTFDSYEINDCNQKFVSRPYEQASNEFALCSDDVSLTVENDDFKATPYYDKDSHNDVTCITSQEKKNPYDGECTKKKANKLNSLSRGTIPTSKVSNDVIRVTLQQEKKPCEGDSSIATKTLKKDLANPVSNRYVSSTPMFSSGDANEFIDNFFSPTSDQALVECLSQYEEDISQEKNQEEGLLIDTPPCVDLSTPMTSYNVIAPTSSRTCMRDITNFSHLGDSILIENNSSKDGGCIQATPLQPKFATQEKGINEFEKSLRRKLNMTDKASEEERPNYGGFDESLEGEFLSDTEAMNSPLCLADRLKAKRNGRW